MSAALMSPARCPDCGAHLTLRMDCTRGETWPCTCRRGLFGAPPPESIAATVEALAKPVCARCNDTHRVPAPNAGPFGDGTWMCTSCPVPCRSCANDCGRGAFCAVTPCPCACHGRREPVLSAPTDLHRANARRIIAEQRLETLRDALREQAETWRSLASDLREDCEVDYAYGIDRCARDLERLLAAQAGREPLAESPAPETDVVR